jgi:hypothetical protein
MSKEEFVEVIKLIVIDGSIKSVESNLLDPPGRQPGKELAEMSNWFRKEIVKVGNKYPFRQMLVTQSTKNNNPPEVIFNFIETKEG